MQATGKIIAILEPRSGIAKASGNPWFIQGFVLQTEEQYPKKIPFEVSGEDRVKNFNIQMGETLTISFDIDAKEWNGKWIPSIRCFNISRGDGQQQAAPAQTQNQQPAHQAAPAPQAPPPDPLETQGGADDDVPF